ncbi:MAG: helix-turn-helix domain-containing protein, partial [Bdellovibrionota bacterium]
DKALEALKSYSWPGNIRELQNRLERAIILAGSRDVLVEEDFDLSTNQLGSSEDSNVAKLNIGNVSLKEAKNHVEKQHILRILNEVEGNRTKACEILQLSREGLRKAMLKHKIAA